MANRKVKFTGEVVRKIWGDSPNFRIFAVECTEEEIKKHQLKRTKYGSVSIMGSLHELGIGLDYIIEAEETHTDKNGYSYKVINISRDKPKNQAEFYTFLKEILTENQAKTMYEAYPDIVQRVIEGRLDDVDLSKTKGIKEHTFNLIKERIVDNYAMAELIMEFQGRLTMNMIKQIFEKYPSVKAVKEELRKTPYKCLCGLSRVGFKKADTILLELEKEKIIDFGFDLATSADRCLACIKYYLEQNELEGNTKMDLLELRTHIISTVPQCKDKFVDALKDSDIYYDKKSLVVALKGTYETEKYIANRIKEALSIKNVWDINTSRYTTVDGFELSEEQQQTCKVINKNQIAILSGSAGCVDCDTEYFNGKGWNKISNYKEGDSVLQYNKDGSSELVLPSRYIKQEAEYLWHFKTKYGLDQCLSDEHECYYITSEKNLYHKPFEEVRADQSRNGFHGKFITTFDYEGKGINLSDNKIRLMVAVFADGHFSKNSMDKDSSVYKQVRLHIKKQRKKERLEFLLNSMNMWHRVAESKEKGYHDYYFYVPFIAKQYPKEWYNCSKHQLEIITDEVMNWDGDYKKQNNYSTTIKSDADFIQFAYTALGYRATISTYDRTCREDETCENTYIRKSVEYTVMYNNRVLVGMCTDNQPNIEKTPIERYKTLDGYEYCFTVPSHMLVLRRNGKIFITGNCGKSASSKSVIDMCIDNNKTFCLMAPTGRASKVLAEYTNREASTIHRGLDFNPSLYSETGGWGFYVNNTLPVDLVVVDEFSMCDIFLFKRLLDAIDFHTTKLLLIGDQFQIPSISAGNLLHDFINSNKIPRVSLSKVFRYASGGLIKVATDIRNGKKYLDNIHSVITPFGNDYTFIATPDEKMIDMTLQLYKKVISEEFQKKHNMNIDVKDVQVLISKNVSNFGTVVLNKELQKIANKNYGSSKYFRIGDTLFYEDDLVIQTKNDYHVKIYYGDMDLEEENEEEVLITNGEIGKIKLINIKESFAVIDFDGVEVKYTKENMNNILLGYSITTFKAQGSGIKIPIVLTARSNIFMENNNLLYVALTRTKEMCFHLGLPRTIDMCIGKKANWQRKTFMQELLNS